MSAKPDEDDAYASKHTPPMDWRKLVYTISGIVFILIGIASGALLAGSYIANGLGIGGPEWLLSRRFVPYCGGTALVLAVFRVAFFPKMILDNLAVGLKGLSRRWENSPPKPPNGRP